MTPEDQLLRVFVQEAADQVDSLEAALLALEERPGDVEQLNRVMRLFHSLKGAAGTVGLAALAELVHETESTLDEVRRDRLPATPDLFNRVFEVVDAVRGNVMAVTKGDDQSDKLHELRTSLQTWRHAAPQERPASASGSDVDGFRLAEYDRVRINVLRKQHKPLYRIEVRCPSASSDDASNAILQSLHRVADVVSSSTRTAGDEGIRVLLLVGSALPRQELHQAIRDAGLTDATVAEWSEPVTSSTPARARANDRVQDTVRVAVDRLDRLMERVGELVIVESIVKHAPEIADVSSQSVRSAMRLLTRISLDLQDTAMSMRMVPMRGSFRRMERLVRDLARSTGKQVRLEMRGETTEVDRAIADRLSEPLMHLVRNSVDHGIEPDTERSRLNKAPIGTVRLSAAHEGGAIVLEVSDDGRGLDRDAILAKAQLLGLVSRDVPLGEAELTSLIFTPTFSTAREVTELSGRGFGLDVVKRVVESMRGRISVSSAPGQGTTFRIMLPLTLAIIDGTLIQCGGERYVVPTLNIVECLHPAPQDFTRYGGGSQALRVRGDLVPVLPLATALAVDAPTAAGQHLVVVVESTGRRVGLLVDDVLVQQQVVIKNIHAPSFDTRLFSGAAILSDGHIGLILNVDELIAAPRAAAALADPCVVATRHAPASADVLAGGPTP